MRSIVRAITALDNGKVADAVSTGTVSGASAIALSSGGGAEARLSAIVSGWTAIARDLDG